ncbi:flagellar basal body P-ring biosynthesis protein FlgA [Dinoroseobacter shibae DFL 12 = DSM 16493]|jgi:flagella basal body P-ring formation protein FlgA|uniref:Flagella basal body P-ring formation protein FlgA n=1 Tax=Dinoroseobacter shibae (strain DSM 16493 / NCIMB 14021 / DFL 12) TaxID=398580 RepID=A8LMR1_DINSH|nr:flagellar basal body P-ring formation chaperone FlgA [Dinoroseobacter shibae]ABV94986.1 flagellar basal body P-ring biosynthesis protein FlgA [Dinoroseobacter shibae DFL 12 = DSM 16493]URF46405.1 flagellar basal body P-ring formation protein FlgA [Dinoroseobacter shibae]URF50711.1 flagellar basal body P-ring formation protein FlgA [Dinoroseobacter shibae]
MTRWLILSLAVLMGVPAAAETLVAARTIRAQAILTAEDLNLTPGSTPGALSRPEEAIGLESRVILYAGRPILADQVGPPALVERNELVSLVYATPFMRIATEGRALGRAGLGESLRVLNISSKTTVRARVTGPGQAIVETP